MMPPEKFARDAKRKWRWRNIAAYALLDLALLIFLWNVRSQPLDFASPDGRLAVSISEDSAFRNVFKDPWQRIVLIDNATGKQVIVKEQHLRMGFHYISFSDILWQPRGNEFACIWICVNGESFCDSFRVGVNPLSARQVKDVGWVRNEMSRRRQHGSWTQRVKARDALKRWTGWLAY